MKFIETIFPDHFSQADRRGVLMGTLLSLIASIFLYKTPAPTRKEVTKPIARLESFSNNVRYRDSGSASFYNAEPGEVFQNRDEIFTGEKSDAIIRFPGSKTTLKIPSSSLIKIEEGENGEAVEIKDGGVDIVLQKDQVISLNSNGINHQIRSSQKESAVKIFYSSGELHLFTKDKGVKIKNANGESELVFNQDSIIKPLSPPHGNKANPAKPNKETVGANSGTKKIFISHDNRQPSDNLKESEDNQEAQPASEQFSSHKKADQIGLTYTIKIVLSLLLTFFFLLACF